MDEKIKQVGKPLPLVVDTMPGRNLRLQRLIDICILAKRGIMIHIHYLHGLVKI